MAVIHTDAGAIEYQITGTSNPCLILHGGHSNCHDELGTEEVAMAGMAALVPSRPGYGQTTVKATSASDSANMIVRLLDERSIDRLPIIAISAAGPTGIHLASQFPLRVTGLVLASAVSKRWLTARDGMYIISKFVFRPGVEKVTWRILNVMLNLSEGFVFRLMLRSLTTQRPKDILKILTDADLQVFRAMLQNLSSGSGFMHDLEHAVSQEVLQSIICPTLIVHSTNDNSVKIDHARHAHQHIPASTLLELDSWGHLIWIGPESMVTKQQIAKFLQTLPT